MALTKHWKKIAVGISVYVVGLVGLQQYMMAQRTPEELEAKSDEWNQWAEAKEEVRKECNRYSHASLDCQTSAQAAGMGREASQQRCSGSIEAYKKCLRRKTAMESRSGFLSSKQNADAQADKG